MDGYAETRTHREAAAIVTAEQIVRALAATDPYKEKGDWCGLCGLVASRPHDEGCLWRLAVEWVTTQDSPAPPVVAYDVALHLAFTDKHGHGWTDSGRWTIEARSEHEALVLAALKEEVPKGHTASAMPHVSVALSSEERAVQLQMDRALYGVAFTEAGQRVDPTSIKPVSELFGLRVELDPSVLRGTFRLKQAAVCPVCGQEEPPPPLPVTPAEALATWPEVIACACSSCGTELWWDCGTWRQF